MNLRYLKDLDGIRAIAVVSIIFYHFFPKQVPGGFIGVDIFFVLSGFLITRIITDAINDGLFNLRDFYFRRVSRIFPSLILVLIVTTFFSWFVLFPDEFLNLSKHIKAAATFSSNILLWKENGYFEIASERKPFLHLWSLGIEGQFYLAWPLLLILIHKLNISKASSILFILISSFLFMLIYGSKDPSGDFYLPFGRVWEFCSGSILIFFHKNLNVKLSNILSLFGATLIFAGLGLAAPKGYPDLFTIIPVLGASFLIVARNSYLNKNILSSRLFVTLGLISFPLYLWHWPILVISRMFYAGELTFINSLTLFSLSILFSLITYFFIEKRFQNQGWYASNFLILLMFLIYLTSNIIDFNLGFRNRAFVQNYFEVFEEHDLIWDEFLKHINAKGCNQFTKDVPRPKNYQSMTYCAASKSNLPNAVIFGDSHSADKFYGLVGADSRNNWMLLGNSSCPIDLAFNLQTPSNPRLINDTEGCQEKFESIIEFINNNENFKKIVISFANYEDIDEDKTAISLHDALGKMNWSNRQIFILIDTPQLKINPRDCIRQKSLKCTYEDYEQHLKNFQSKQYRIFYKLIEEYPQLYIYDPTDSFCQKNSNCLLSFHDKSLYYDLHHLTLWGSTYYAIDFLRYLDKVN